MDLTSNGGHTKMEIKEAARRHLAAVANAEATFFGNDLKGDLGHGVTAEQMAQELRGKEITVGIGHKFLVHDEFLGDLFEVEARNHLDALNQTVGSQAHRNLCLSPEMIQQESPISNAARFVDRATDIGWNSEQGRKEFGGDSPNHQIVATVIRIPA